MAVTVAAVSLISQGCSSRTVVSEYQGLPLDGWQQDSVLTWDVDITDSLAVYDVVLSVRHTVDYPFQNIWLFVENGQTGSTDTLEYYLADQRGRWLGNGFGDRKEMPCLVAQGVRFAHPGTYRYAVRQGMRAETLLGVCEVGLIVEKEK